MPVRPRERQTARRPSVVSGAGCLPGLISHVPFFCERMHGNAVIAESTAEQAPEVVAIVRIEEDGPLLMPRCVTYSGIPGSSRRGRRGMVVPGARSAATVLQIGGHVRCR